MNDTTRLSAPDRAACAVVAAAMHGAAGWSLVAGLTALAVLAAVVNRGAATGALAVLVPLVVAERYAAWRVALDARLFDRLANGELPDLAELDGALQHVFAVPATKAGRALPERIAGARRLLRAQAGTHVLLIALAVAAWWPVA